MRFQYVLSEIRAGLRRNLTMTVAVIITVAVSIAMFGTGMLIAKQVEITKDYWYDKVEVSVYLCNNYTEAPGCADGAVTKAQRESIGQTLEAHPEVDEVFFETQKEAYEHFKDQQADLAQSITADQLPASFRVALKDPEKFEGVVSAVSGLAGVESVVDQRELFASLFSMLNGLRNGAMGIAGLQVVAAVLLIANTIRLAAYNRRRETGIMRLVGASSFYIQLPFILEAAIAGLIGSAFGVGTIFALQEFVIDNRVAPNFNFTNWVQVGDVWAMMPALLLAGFLISAIAAFFTLRRYLRV